MKKAIILFLILALSSALLCACTSPDPEDSKPASDYNLPNPSAVNGQTQTEANGQTQNQPVSGDNRNDAQSSSPSSPQTQTDADESVEPVEDTEMETVSEYVVDGGNGFGFGGN